MKGNDQVIKHLNAILKNELTAINQYFLHSRMFKDWGLDRIGDYEYKESLDEMQHADKLIERILFLEGLPNLQSLGKLYIGENLQECLECDLKLERIAHPPLLDAVAHCESVSDYVSRELFESILESEEEHIDWLETQPASLADGIYKNNTDALWASRVIDLYKVITGSSVKISKITIYMIISISRKYFYVFTTTPYIHPVITGSRIN